MGVAAGFAFRKFLRKLGGRGGRRARKPRPGHLPVTGVTPLMTLENNDTNDAMQDPFRRHIAVISRQFRGRPLRDRYSTVNRPLRPLHPRIPHALGVLVYLQKFPAEICMEIWGLRGRNGVRKFASRAVKFSPSPGGNRHTSAPPCKRARHARPGRRQVPEGIGVGGTLGLPVASSAR